MGKPGEGGEGTIRYDTEHDVFDTFYILWRSFSDLDRMKIVRLLLGLDGRALLQEKGQNQQAVDALSLQEKDVKPGEGGEGTIRYDTEHDVFDTFSILWRSFSDLDRMKIVRLLLGLDGRALLQEEGRTQ